MEIERKFLIAQLPSELELFPHERVRQGYLLSAGEDLEVRLRARDGQRLLTIKHGAGLTREEDEQAIEPARFERLWPLTEGRRIEKLRYVIPLGALLTVELDAYTGALDGLVTAEVEFDSEAQAQSFTPPAWFGPELTGDPRYANQCLTEGLPPALAGEPDFGLRTGELLGDGLRRVVRGQIDAASDQLRGQQGGDPAEAVHEVRKSFKRIRATLKLARDELPPDVYEREIAAFRDAGRQLSGARDAQVLIETLDDLCERYAQEVPPCGFSGMRDLLVAELAVAESAARNADATDALLADLSLARRRLARWRFEHEDPAALAGGFERIYRGGQRALRAAGADPSDERLHEVRKRTKELWHAAEILSHVAPAQTAKLIRLAHPLSDVVGEDHDLAVLAARVRGRPDCFAEAAEQRGLQMLIARRRKKRQRRAGRLGARLYRPRARRLRVIVERAGSERP
jgi:CYTH domain-containing protein/CHAD domain-containing protein